jgi:hypothetical protein
MCSILSLLIIEEKTDSSYFPFRAVRAEQPALRVLLAPPLPRMGECFVSFFLSLCA